MAKKVLLIRSRSGLTPPFVCDLEEQYGEIEFVDIEPKSDDELVDLFRRHQAVAAVLAENPLPGKALDAGFTLIPIRPGPLQRLVSIDPQVEPL